MNITKIEIKSLIPLVFFASTLLQSTLACGRRQVPEDEHPVDLSSSPIGRGFIAEFPQNPPPQLTPPTPPVPPVGPPPAFQSPEVPNPENVMLTDFQIDMIKYVNRTRMQRNLKPLVVDAEMTKSASLWSSYFAERRERQRLADVPYSQNTCAPAINAGDAVAKWLNNPASQATRNIMSPDHTLVGAGAAFSDTGYWYMFFK